MYNASVCITWLLPEPDDHPCNVTNMGLICEKMPGVGEFEKGGWGPLGPVTNSVAGTAYTSFTPTVARPTGDQHPFCSRCWHDETGMV